MNVLTTKVFIFPGTVLDLVPVGRDLRKVKTAVKTEHPPGS